MSRLGRLRGTVHNACGTGDEITECGSCFGVWCDRCDPAHGPLCPWCHGYGYSTAAILAPLRRQANPSFATTADTRSKENAERLMP